MRVKVIFYFVWVLMLAGLAAKAQSYGASSKASFSKGVARQSDDSDDSRSNSGQGRLARVTAYWPGEDYYTTRKMSATGVRLRKGFCAVDSRIIPYGSVVNILGIGTYIAMDTGSAVISRKAARLSGQSWEERHALVIDLYFPNRRAGERFSREGPKFAMVAGQTSELASRE
jgi:3D (Asp-Asp-Asp) domain-containing protein